MQVTGNNVDWEQLEDRVLPHITGDLSTTGYLPSLTDTVSSTWSLDYLLEAPLYISPYGLWALSAVFWGEVGWAVLRAASGPARAGSQRLPPGGGLSGTQPIGQKLETEPH